LSSQNIFPDPTAADIISCSFSATQRGHRLAVALTIFYVEQPKYILNMRVVAFSFLFVFAFVAPMFVSADEQSLSLAALPLVLDVTTSSSDMLTHYGNPATGCEKDEMPFRIQDVPGMICAPKCALGQCPSDVPDGVTATPTCALKTASGTSYCALLCEPSTTTTSSLRGATDQDDSPCGPDATCQPIQGLGICTYPDAAVRVEA
jgi:hypothetical protein